jgi:hypothetical protein
MHDLGGNVEIMKAGLPFFGGNLVLRGVPGGSCWYFGDFQRRRCGGRFSTRLGPGRTSLSRACQALLFGSERTRLPLRPGRMLLPVFLRRARLLALLPFGLFGSGVTGMVGAGSALAA